MMEEPDGEEIEVAADEVASEESAVEALVGCGVVPPNIGNQFFRDAVTSVVSLYTGPSSTCRPPARILPLQDAVYHCFTIGSDGTTWTYLRVPETGARGWAPDELLTDFGSDFYCRF